VNISSVKTGDVVEVDIRGSKFLAYVDELVKEEGKQSSLRITPATRNVTYYSCKANQVIGHYKKMQRAKSGAKRKTSNGETLQAL
jgi:dihydroxyacid dehydratase/phosphogluconate dehydratase